MTMIPSQLVCLFGSLALVACYFPPWTSGQGYYPGPSPYGPPSGLGYPGANLQYPGLYPPRTQQYPGGQYQPPLQNQGNPYGHHGPQYQAVRPVQGQGVPPPEASTACTPSEPPKVDYGDCPQLEPKEEDKPKKEEKQKECLKHLEVSENSTVTALSKGLQDKVKECVLRKDELVNTAGKYNYDKALEKIKEKALPENIDKKVAEAHVECKIQAEQKYLVSNAVLTEVSDYQGCMDFHLAMLCNIKIVKPVPPTTNHFHGLYNLPSQSPSNFYQLPNVPNYANAMNRLNILDKALR